MNDIEKALETIIVNNNSYDTKENVSKETIEKIFASHIGFKREKDKFVDYVYLYDNSGGNFYPVREVVCYAGAPGTGKTSFVNTLAEATGRKLETISCAG
jgi:ATP-dependent Lon protease